MHSSSVPSAPPAARRLWLVVAAIACAIVVLGGCGTDDTRPTRAEYGRQLRATMHQLEAAYGDALAGSPGSASGTGATPPATSDAERVEQLERTRTALTDAAERLNDLQPPEDLASAHDDLVRGVRAMAIDVDDLVEAQRVAKSDPARARQLTRGFATSSARSFQQVQDAAARISDAGVDAGL